MTRNNFGFDLPREFKPPVRNAVVGETILFYMQGAPHELPVLATVTEVVEAPPMPGSDMPVWQIRCKTIEHGRRPTDKDWTRHMGDPFWEDHPLKKIEQGAWDFHPVFRSQVQNWINAAEAREARRRQLELEKTTMSADEVLALDALERHGPKLTVIAKDAGVTPESLKKMSAFWKEFQAAKSREWEDKNTTKGELQPA